MDKLNQDLNSIFQNAKEAGVELPEEEESGPLNEESKKVVDNLMDSLGYMYNSCRKSGMPDHICGQMILNQHMVMLQTGVITFGGEE